MGTDRAPRKGLWTKISKPASLLAIIGAAAGIVLADAKLLWWLLLGAALCVLLIRMTGRASVERWLKNKKLARSKGIRFLVRAVGCALIIILSGVCAYHQRASDARKERTLDQILAEVRALNPGVSQVHPLPSRPGEANMVQVALGKVELRMTLISADERGWTFGIDSMDVGDKIHQRNATVSVDTMRPIAVVTGSDASVLVDVVTLDSGTRIPWIGLVPPVERGKVNSLLRVPIPLMHD